MKTNQGQRWSNHTDRLRSGMEVHRPFRSCGRWDHRDEDQTGNDYAVRCGCRQHIVTIRKIRNSRNISHCSFLRCCIYSRQSRLFLLIEVILLIPRTVLAPSTHLEGNLFFYFSSHTVRLLITVFLFLSFPFHSISIPFSFLLPPHTDTVREGEKKKLHVHSNFIFTILFRFHAFIPLHRRGHFSPFTLVFCFTRLLRHPDAMFLALDI